MQNRRKIGLQSKPASGQQLRWALDSKIAAVAVVVLLATETAMNIVAAAFAAAVVAFAAAVAAAGMPDPSQRRRNCYIRRLAFALAPVVAEPVVDSGSVQ